MVFIGIVTDTEFVGTVLEIEVVMDCFTAIQFNQTQVLIKQHYFNVFLTS